MRQRWYAGRTRELAAVDVESTTPLADRLDHVLLEVRYADGGAEQYQVFVGWDLPLRDEYAALATIGTQDDRIASDALFDEDATRRIVTLIEAGETRGRLRFLPEPDLELELTDAPRVSEAEQSNTSVLFGAEAILKVFRQLVPGINPDVELSQVLARHGSRHVPAVYGTVESSEPDGTPLSLATLSAFAANSGDGWSMATASVRDLLGTVDLRAAEAGGDFSAESTRIGEAVGEVHGTLAEALGTHTGRPPFDRLMERFAAAVATVPELAVWTDEVRAVFAAADTPTTLQRVHGDLHLGQVLRAPENWLLIDFEGEPGAPIAERRALDSPIRDVAGMMRSFDYASHQLLVDDPDDEELALKATDWVERNQDAFCVGYASATGTDPRDHATLLRAYEIDKLVYEVAYESRFRPTWKWIPERAVRRMFAPAAVRLPD
jgi:maltokinase